MDNLLHVSLQFSHYIVAHLVHHTPYHHELCFLSLQQYLYLPHRNGHKLTD